MANSGKIWDRKWKHHRGSEKFQQLIKTLPITANPEKQYEVNYNPAPRGSSTKTVFCERISVAAPKIIETAELCFLLCGTELIRLRDINYINVVNAPARQAPVSAGHALRPGDRAFSYEY